ncbi:BAG_1a_G0015400.mRNA.1.CDS.1 [Saccharomyces cerevisiae]|nr:SX2_G0001860.mRNA.1.CDS.1 [Saccharomyces cerevisiae]CAI4439953.1 BAG_1a_G0015400.mRNA.1.CDS.1 [Saccharomyces cerevisiae]CAI7107721.1 BAG_1a_G0015400.mRNA.1.CDS.1 [Saccharomyces cerevisiae]
MYSNHNLNSDDCCFDWNEEKAAELQRTGVSFDRSLTPQSLRTSTRRLSEENKQQSGTMHIDTSPSVVSDIISSRRDRSQDFFGPHSSSPIAPSERQRADQRSRLESMRLTRRRDKMTKVRGGLEKMEEMIMQGEHLREMQRLKQEAQKNALPSDMAEYMEWQNNEDLEDDELLAFIEKQETYKNELEHFLNNANKNVYQNNSYPNSHT